LKKSMGKTEKFGPVGTKRRNNKRNVSTKRGKTQGGKGATCELTYNLAKKASMEKKKNNLDQ